MNIFKAIISDIRNIAIILLVITMSVYIVKANSLKNKLERSQFEYTNQLALSDSMRTINKDTYHRLAIAISEKDLEKIAKEAIQERINGKVHEINELNIKVINLINSLSNLQISKIDTVYIEKKIFYEYKYPYNYENMDYAINGIVSVTSIIKPRKVNVDYDVKFEPVKLTIITTKNSDFSYSITVKSSSNFIKLINMNSYIPPPVLAADLPFYKKIDFGIGAGIDPEGDGFLLGGIKYSKNTFNLMYSGGNGNYGAQYQRWIFGN